MRTHKIDFFCYNNDTPIEIQLEPEVYVFIVNPGNTLTFVAYSEDNFYWALRVDHESKGVQLLPEYLGEGYIEIFENGQLLDNWYKYM